MFWRCRYRRWVILDRGCDGSALPSTTRVAGNQTPAAATVLPRRPPSAPRPDPPAAPVHALTLGPPAHRDDRHPAGDPGTRLNHLNQRVSLEPRAGFHCPVVDVEAEKVFTTYSNYLLHVRNCLAGTYGVGDDLHDGLAVATRSRRPYRKIQRRSPTADEAARLRKALRLVWVTEAQLRLRGQHDLELLPDLLQGAASEAYYAVYHAARAFFVAGGFSVQATHAAVLNQLSTVIVDRGLLPAPWSVTVTGGPRRADFQVAGVPPTAPPPGPVHEGYSQ